MAVRIHTLVAALATSAATLVAQPKSPVRVTGSAALKAQAKISADSATRIALARVPGGVARSAELEKEKGKLIYSYDIKVPGKPGVEEVNIDAMTGAVVAQEHESAAAEAREAKSESSAKKAPAKRP